jgi:dipeptidyl aminopeptidase/acylaminoacyl peptidase
LVAEIGKPSREVMPLQSSAQYVEPGYLLFTSEGALLGQRFDLSRGEIAGAPFSIAAPVSHSFTTTVARFAASPSGTLVYQSRSNDQSVEWFDRSGRQLGSIADRGEYQQIRISPDGQSVAFSRSRGGATDVWQIDLERRSETRLTFGPSSEGAGPWTPDGKTLFFNADVGAPPAIFRKNLTTGVETPALPPTGTFQEPEDVSPDGKTLLYTQRGAGGNDIWLFALDGKGPPVRALETLFEEFGVRFSPDGRYFSFGSTMSGGPEIYLSPFPPTGEKIRVSSAGGNLARWSRDGRELLYQSADSRLMAVAVQTSPSLRVGTPQPLFELALRRPWYAFDVAPDGRILAIVQQARARDQPLTVVLNWTAELPE